MIATEALVDHLTKEVRNREAELAMVEAQNEVLFSLVAHLRQCRECHSIEWCPEALELWEAATGH